MRQIGCLLSSLSATFFFAAFAQAQQVPVTTASLPEMMSARLSALRLQLARPVPTTNGEDRDDRVAMSTFYGCDAAAPLWVNANGLTSQAVAAIAEIKRAAEWGLNAADFKLPEVPEDASLSPEQLADAEQKLSLAVLKYTRHAHGGRISDPAKQLSSYLDRKPVLPDALKVLAALSTTVRPDAFLRSQHPKHPQFEALRQEYRRLTEATGIVAAYKIPGGRTIKPGTSHEHIAILRKRLGVAVPVIDGNPDENFYDVALVAKVKEFQLTAQIEPANGVINDRTRKALNATSDKDNVRRLLASMEAWRWMPEQLGETYVWVNVPEFTVRVMKNGVPIHTERVVTGKVHTQTPIFSDLMKTVVFQPQWGLPDSIKINEILPRLQAGGGLRADLRMQRNGKDVDPYNIDWFRANILDYHVYQPSGEDNALGQVKFLFPNKHQVYMHDTPSKGLFKESQRTFSHGCVRVRNPVRLAQVVLGEDKGWPAAQVQTLIDEGPENNRVPLDKSLPVHITYFTAMADDTGKIQYFRDIYGHEKRISLATEGRWKEIVKTPDHLAPITQPRPAFDEFAELRRKRMLFAEDGYLMQDRRGGYYVVPQQQWDRRNPPPQYFYSTRSGLTRTPPPPPPKKGLFGKIFGF